MPGSIIEKISEISKYVKVASIRYKCIESFITNPILPLSYYYISMHYNNYAFKNHLINGFLLQLLLAMKSLVKNNPV